MPIILQEAVPIVPEEKSIEVRQTQSPIKPNPPVVAFSQMSKLRKRDNKLKQKVTQLLGNYICKKPIFVIEKD